MEDKTVLDRLIGVEIGGKYKIIRMLGEGGMGCVYQGEQKLGTTIRKVAIKTLHEHLSHDPQILARFEREVGTVAGLQHPNTIQVFDFGKMDDGTLYIVMEFVEGKSVGGVLEESGPMEPARVANILKQVCGSLEEAHGLGIVHRDLKPDNVVLCDKAGVHDWVEVLDFGIAKRSSEVDEREQKLTQQGMVLGTPPYMSPEQFTGKPVDRRSDIYSLAVMAYEMLTGGLPFNGNTAWEWATAHMTAQPRPLETFPTSGRIPPAMKAAILRGLEKEPDRRFPNVTEFFAAFSSAGGPYDAPASAYGAGAMAAAAYGAGQTQAGGGITPPPQYQTGPHPTGAHPVGPYATGPHPYGTPATGSHTYTPQPFPQMVTPAPVMPEQQPQKKGSGLGIVLALLAMLILVGGGGAVLYATKFHVGSAAQTQDTSKVASTAPTDTTTVATAVPITSDTTPIEPLALGSSHASSLVATSTATPKTPTTTSTTGAPTQTAAATTTTPAYTAAPTNTATTTYTPIAPTNQVQPQNPNEPAVCQSARQAHAQGARRIAAELAHECIRQGGHRPF
jgi:serine/threonine-protein kinase